MLNARTARWRGPAYKNRSTTLSASSLAALLLLFFFFLLILLLSPPKFALRLRSCCSSPAKMSSGLSAQLSPCYKVAILHPDLGIGGAERLVLDAALELSKIGCNVRIAKTSTSGAGFSFRKPPQVVLYTVYHDVNRCFEETLLDGKRVNCEFKDG